MERRRYGGGCHCGALRVTFESAQPLAPRACQCSFCRKHGARSVSDPEGAATLCVSLAPVLYRFASRAADYVLCGRCGVYMGAIVEADGRRLGTLNLNTFDDPIPGLAATPVTYDMETPAAKAERRKERWTPILIEGPAAI